jgi:hypothetical protein
MIIPPTGYLELSYLNVYTEGLSDQKQMGNQLKRVAHNKIVKSKLVEK